MPHQPPRFVRYHDLDPAALNVEYQVHTTQTDGQASIREILDAARTRGLSALAFTEHVRRETDWFAGFARAIRDEARSYPEMRVFAGCEAKALDEEGGFDASEEILRDCDIVLGSVHRFPDGEGGFLDFKSLEAQELAEMECRLSLGLLKNAPIHVLAHPGGMYQRRFGVYPPHLFRKMMQTSLERSIAVEINASYLVDVEGFLSLCEEINPFVSIGSDVHKLNEVGHCRDIVMKLRNENGVKP